jgi:hypothetical protein
MPLMAVQIVADYLLFDSMQINLYDLPGWLADEVRYVLTVYHANTRES